MKLAVLASGRLREEYALLGCALYARRIAAFTPLEIVEAPEPRGANADACGKSLEARRRAGDRLVLLSDRGRLMTSAALAKTIGSALGGGQGRFMFVVGGPYGFGEEFERRADDLIAFGRQTMPHELARLVLLEQIYRSLTILKGMPYHHG